MKIKFIFRNPKFLTSQKFKNFRILMALESQKSQKGKMLKTQKSENLTKNIVKVEEFGNIENVIILEIQQ